MECFKLNENENSFFIFSIEWHTRESRFDNGHKPTLKYKVREKAII